MALISSSLVRINPISSTGFFWSLAFRALLSTFAKTSTSIDKQALRSCSITRKILLNDGYEKYPEIAKSLIGKEDASLIIEKGH
mgnify:CR=1 FL=1